MHRAKKWMGILITGLVIWMGGLAFFDRGKERAAELSSQNLHSVPADKMEYILLGFNDLGMHCYEAQPSVLQILPVFNVPKAQVIKRGAPPQIMTPLDGITVEFEFVDYQGDSRWAAQNHLTMKEWIDHGNKQLAGAVKAVMKVDMNVTADKPGITGFGYKGKMDWSPEEETESGYFFAKGTGPVSLIDQAPGFNKEALLKTKLDDDIARIPAELSDLKQDEYIFQRIKFTAYKDGKEIATTFAALPAGPSGCIKCHGKMEDGLLSTLKIHDTNHGTHLLDIRNAIGTGIVCAVCHADPAVNVMMNNAHLVLFKDNPEANPFKDEPQSKLSLSRALHDWHSDSDTTLTGQVFPDKPTKLKAYDGDINTACQDCHPSPQRPQDRPTDTNPKGCYRGAHFRVGITCGKTGTCHGDMREMATNPYTPWSAKAFPECENCHGKMKGGKPFEKAIFIREDQGKTYTNEFGHSKRQMSCLSCHGPIHGEMPSLLSLDNNPAIQYQGVEGPIGVGGRCNVCHTDPQRGKVHQSAQ